MAWPMRTAALRHDPTHDVVVAEYRRQTECRLEAMACTTGGGPCRREDEVSVRVSCSSRRNFTVNASMLCMTGETGLLLTNDVSVDRSDHRRAFGKARFGVTRDTLRRDRSLKGLMTAHATRDSGVIAAQVAGRPEAFRIVP